jgi:hypothetical protein
MSNTVRSARGVIVDFDLLRMQHEANNAINNPKSVTSPRNLVPDPNFINSRIAAAASKQALAEAMQSTPVDAVQEITSPEPAAVVESTKAPEPVRKIKRDANA